MQVTARMIKPAIDMQLGTAEPSARTLANVAALRPFIAAACAEYTVHSTYLNRVMTHVSKQGISKKAHPSEQGKRDRIKRELGQVQRSTIPRVCSI